jgi:hypothetical protein
LESTAPGTDVVSEGLASSSDEFAALGDGKGNGGNSGAGRGRDQDKSDKNKDDTGKGGKGKDNAEAERDEDGAEGEDDPAKAEVKGTVAGLPEGTRPCPALTFTVGTTTVKTDASTIFDDVTCLTLASGDIVEVAGTKQTDGSILAKTVELGRYGTSPRASRK